MNRASTLIAYLVCKTKLKLFLSEGSKKTVLSLIISAIVIVLDQLSKSWIRSHLTLGESLTIAGRLSFTHIGNTGSAFGLLANETFLLIIITIATLLIILLFLRFLLPFTIFSIVSTGLIFGGAVGNLIDRIYLGHVTDFIYIRLWGNFYWPAFNLADSAIVVGILVLACSLIYSFRKGNV